MAGHNGYYYLNEPNFFHTNSPCAWRWRPSIWIRSWDWCICSGRNTDLGDSAGGGWIRGQLLRGSPEGKYVPDHPVPPTRRAEGSHFGVSPVQSGATDSALWIGAGEGPAITTFTRETMNWPGFVLPRNHSTLRLAGGFAGLGGREPLLHPDPGYGSLGLVRRTVSQRRRPLWVEGRPGAGARLAPVLGRALLIYTLPESKQSIDFSVTGGTSAQADRFSAYRLGGGLPLASEFPLSIPGYFYQELSARSFVSVSAQYTLPLDADKTWNLSPMGSLAGGGLSAGNGAAGQLQLRGRAGLWLPCAFRRVAGHGHLRLRIRGHSSGRARRARGGDILRDQFARQAPRRPDPAGPRHRLFPLPLLTWVRQESY